MPDQVLTCVERDCRSQFTLTDSDQNFFVSKGMSLPKRCKPCRQKKRLANNAALATQTPTSPQPEAPVHAPRNNWTNGNDSEVDGYRKRQGRDRGNRRRDYEE